MHTPLKYTPSARSINCPHRNLMTIHVNITINRLLEKEKNETSIHQDL